MCVAIASINQPHPAASHRIWSKGRRLGASGMHVARALWRTREISWKYGAGLIPGVYGSITNYYSAASTPLTRRCIGACERGESPAWLRTKGGVWFHATGRVGARLHDSVRLESNGSWRLESAATVAKSCARPHNFPPSARLPELQSTVAPSVFEFGKPALRTELIAFSAPNARPSFSIARGFCRRASRVGAFHGSHTRETGAHNSMRCSELPPPPST